MRWTGIFALTCALAVGGEARLHGQAVAPQFSSGTMLPGASQVDRADVLLALDLDLDGVLDLQGLAGSIGSSSYMGRGDGSFQVVGLPPTSVFINTPWDDSTVADWDGDGRLDLPTYGGCSSRIWWGSTAPPYWQGYTDLPCGVSRVYGAGDADGDGLLDAFCLASNRPAYVRYLGNRTFAPAVTFIGPTVVLHYWSSGSLPGVVADVNQDGFPDLLFDAYLALSTGPGSWTTSVMTPLNAPGAMGGLGYALVDANLDGWLDLLGLLPAGNPSVPIGMGLSVALAVPGPPFGFQSFGSFWTSTSVSNPNCQGFLGCYYTLRAGDFNGDSYPDVALARLDASQIWVLTNDGTGTSFSELTPPLPIATPTFCPSSIAAGDFNLDGRTDLAVGMATTHPSPVTVFFNSTALAATAQRFGASCYGPRPFPPLVGPLGLPFQGQPSFGVIVAGGIPQGTAHLVFALQGANIPLSGTGCGLYVDLTSTISPFPGYPLPLDAYGKAFLPLPLTTTSGLSGLTVYLQAWMLDPSPTNPLGYLLTTSLILTLG